MENGHLNEKNMILKIDVEYSEWEALYDISEDILKHFKYILLEFHFWKNETIYYYSVIFHNRSTLLPKNINKKRTTYTRSVLSSFSFFNLRHFFYSKSLFFNIPYSIAVTVPVMP